MKVTVEYDITIEELMELYTGMAMSNNKIVIQTMNNFYSNLFKMYGLK